MLVKGHMLYNCKVVCIKKLVRRQFPKPITTDEVVVLLP
ncbi:hypothetical protein MTR67_024046 [Solanum verrucosum]|uniref:Uncharacterized protein n=1 Tax=Solanum verrucosum TaxID=315347 RepID=A0AAF0QWB6_SOLVR|nr:hypothetical protein MTR67_024046 [Solanum verrucosum]